MDSSSLLPVPAEPVVVERVVHHYPTPEPYHRPEPRWEEPPSLPAMIVFGLAGIGLKALLDTRID